MQLSCASFLCQSRIDLDQQFINRQVDMATQDAFEDAKSVYELGAFSKSIASLELTQSIGMSLQAGASIAGRSESDAAISAIAAKNIQASDTVIQAQYLLEGCNVGGLAESSPVIDGCECKLMLFPTVSFTQQRSHTRSNAPHGRLCVGGFS